MEKIGRIGDIWRYLEPFGAKFAYFCPSNTEYWWFLGELELFGGYGAIWRQLERVEIIGDVWSNRADG